jgi:hypothetical protein
MLPFLFGWGASKLLGQGRENTTTNEYDTLAKNNETWKAKQGAIQNRLGALGGYLNQVKSAQVGAEGPFQAKGPNYQDDQYKNTAVGQAYQAKKFEGALPEYDYIRNKISEQSNASNQTAQDAIKRRFASMGALNSGAAVKQAQLQNESSEKQKADQMQEVSFQEAQARRGLEREEAQKEYQSQEALKGREFSASESGLGRKFTAQQAADSRNFEAEQQMLQRSMQRDIFNADQQFKTDVFKFDSASKLAEMDVKWAEIEQDRETTQFNIRNELYKRQHTGGLFGNGGFLGLG